MVVISKTGKKMILKKLKIESLDPTGVVIEKYELVYKVSEPESMRVTRLLLTIDNREYWLRNNGDLNEITRMFSSEYSYQGDWGWNQ